MTGYRVMDGGAGPQAVGIESQLKVQDLNARYVEAIDEGRFEDWPDLFMEHCKYRITTAENVEQGLPLSIIYATSRAMHTGDTALFATGRYLDRVVLAGGAALFAEKTVILDSRQIDTLLAIPL